VRVAAQPDGSGDQDQGQLRRGAVRLLLAREVWALVGAANDEQDAATAHGYSISSRCLGQACGGPQDGVVRLAFPDHHGGVIAVLESDPGAPDGVTIVRFDPRRGTREVLDAGSHDDIMVSPDNQPPGSGVWTHGGQPRSAPLYVPPA
jgi:hypothetical protein